MAVRQPVQLPVLRRCFNEAAPLRERMGATAHDASASASFNEAAPLRERMDPPLPARPGRAHRCFNEAAPLRERMEQLIAACESDPEGLQ